MTTETPEAVEMSVNVECPDDTSTGERANLVIGAAGSFLGAWIREEAEAMVAAGRPISWLEYRQAIVRAQDAIAAHAVRQMLTQGPATDALLTSYRDMPLKAPQYEVTESEITMPNGQRATQISRKRRA
jgi:hypothetical protein